MKFEKITLTAAQTSWLSKHFKHTKNEEICKKLNLSHSFCAAVAGFLLDKLNIELGDYVQFSRNFFKTEKISINRVLIFAKDGKNYDAMCDDTFAMAIITKILQMIVDKHKGTTDWII